MTITQKTKMKRIALLLILLLASCGPAVRGGNIIGKYTKMHDGGLLEDDYIRYYLQLQNNDSTGGVEVTKEAWEQAKSGMVWPFEVK